MNQRDYDMKYGFYPSPPPRVSTLLRNQARRLQQDYCSAKGFFKTIQRRIPVTRWLRKYNFKKQFISDVIAGLTVGIYNIPQALAYSVLASLPPVFGLYASFFPPLIYFLLGSSYHISIGVFSLTCLMVGHTRLSLLPDHVNGTATEVHGIPDVEPIDIVITLSFLTGMIQVGMALLRLDFMTSYLSDPAVSGLTFGAALHALSSQLSSIIGVQLPHTNKKFLKLFYTFGNFFKALPELNPVTTIITAVTILLLVLAKIFIEPRTKNRGFPFPSELIVLIIGTIVSKCADLHDRWNVPTVNHVPLGMPSPRLPRFALIPFLIDDAASIAVVAYAVTVSMGKLFARKHRYRIDTNQELYALGVAGIGSSFFSVFPASTSLSRSLVNEESGAQTQLSGLVSSLLILCVILWVGPVLEPLPMCVLAAIVIVALRSLFMKITEVPKLWKFSKLDVIIWVTTATVTISYDIIEGLAAGMAVAFFLVVTRTQFPKFLTLGEVAPGDFHSASNYEKTQRTAVPVLRFDAALIFTNVEIFKDKIRDTVNTYKPDYPKVVILDCTPWACTDSMGVEAVKEINEELSYMGVSLFFANLRSALRIQYEQAGLFVALHETQFYPTIENALVMAEDYIKKAKKEEQLSIS